MDKQFKEGGRYLVGENYIESLTELRILEVSEKAIKVKFDNGNSQWYLKDKFPYKFIEELSVVKQTIEDRSHEIQFDDDWHEKDEPQFTLKLTEENDEIILKAEEKLKLEWENPSKNFMTWDESMSYAKSLGDGWRLPTIQELKEAYESNVQGFFGRSYWSLSTLGRDNNRVWCLKIWNGERGCDYKMHTNWVRCVREMK